LIFARLGKRRGAEWRRYGCVFHILYEYAKRKNNDRRAFGVVALARWFLADLDRLW